jgi:2-haloacid dehalogenase
VPRILVFDVNETLLDVAGLAPLFARVFGDGSAVRECFATLLLYSEVATLAGPYADFGAIGGRCARHGRCDSRSEDFRR